MNARRFIPWSECFYLKRRKKAMKRASRFSAIAPNSQVANDQIRGGDHGSPTLQVEQQSCAGRYSSRGCGESDRYASIGQIKWSKQRMGRRGLIFTFDT
jgi:hypothetical protein